MLDYSKAILDKTQKELETALRIFQFGTQIIYIIYLFYLLFTPNEIWYLHLSLLIISAAFFVFDIFSTKEIRSIKEETVSKFGKRKHQEKLTRAKKRKNTVRLVKFYVSHVIKLFVLASTFYPIIVAPDTVHPLSIMCTTVMVLLWILQIIFEVIRFVLEGRAELFMEALRADVEFVTKPVNKIKDTFNTLMGKEVEDRPEPTKARLYLDELVEAVKSEKNAKKSESQSSKTQKLTSWLDEHLSHLNDRRGTKEELLEEDFDKKDHEEV